jgi:hypothetical protein
MILEIESGGTRPHSVEKSLCTRLWTCPKTEYGRGARARVRVCMCKHSRTVPHNDVKYRKHRQSVGHCEISGYYSGAVEGWSLLGCYDTKLGKQFQTFRRIVVPSPSRSSSPVLGHGNTIIRNFGSQLTNDTALTSQKTWTSTYGIVRSGDPMSCQHRHRGKVEVKLQPSCNMALEGDALTAPRSSRLTPGEKPVPIVLEAGWASRPVWRHGKSCAHRDSIPGPSSP